jgi:hypothetical protein
VSQEVVVEAPAPANQHTCPECDKLFYLCKGNMARDLQEWQAGYSRIVVRKARMTRRVIQLNHDLHVLQDELESRRRGEPRWPQL